MDGVSSAAAIVQIMGNAINAAITTARFVNGVRKAEIFHNDFVHGLERSQSTVELMRKQLSLSDSQETKDICKLVDEISKDCDKCHEGLVRLHDTRTSNIIGRVTGEFKMEMRKPEIESMNARLRTNVGNIQTLLSVLQVTSQAVSTEQIEDRLQDMQANMRCLPQLRDEVIAALKNLKNNRDYARGTEGSELIDPVCNEMDLSRDASACLRITEDTLRTANSIYERLSRSGSVHNPSSLSENELPEIPVQSHCDGTSVMMTHPLPTMTVFLDYYIQGMKEEFAKGDYERSKKYLQEALVWGERRYSKYQEEFYEWFDLQLRLVEICEKEGKFQDAQNYITRLRESSSAADDALAYRRISKLQEVQLGCTAARLCLYGYEELGDTYMTTDGLKRQADAAFGAASKVFQDALLYDEGEGSNTVLQDLLVESAKTLDKVFEIFDDPVGRGSIRAQHAILREELPPLDPIVPSTPHGRRTRTTSNSPSMLVLRPPSTCGSSEAQSPTAGSTPITVPSARNSGGNFYGSPGRVMNALFDDAFSTEETNDAGQTTTLITAVKKHDLELLEKIGSEESVVLNINAMDDAGMNALHHALTTMDGEETVKLLIAKGIDVNASDSRGGDTPLHYCIRRSNYKAAKLLLRTKKVAIESVNKANQTPAQLAIQQSGGIMSNPDIVKLLIKYKANFNWPGIPREIRNNLRKLGYDESSFSSNLDDASSTASVTDRRPQPREHRYSRSSQSSHSSQHSRWTQVIATMSRNN